MAKGYTDEDNLIIEVSFKERILGLFKKKTIKIPFDKIISVSIEEPPEALLRLGGTSLPLFMHLGRFLVQHKGKRYKALYLIRNMVNDALIVTYRDDEGEGLLVVQLPNQDELMRELILKKQ